MSDPYKVDRDLIERARELGAQEDGLVVVFVSRPNLSASASVVNAGIMSHPATREPIVGFVARGYARKLANMRMQRRVTVVFRSGWEWVAVEGDAELVGPDDLPKGIESAAVPQLLRDVYAAAVGGKADDWAALDEVFAAERHTAVLIRPVRVYSNPIL